MNAHRCGWMKVIWWKEGCRSRCCQNESTLQLRPISCPGLWQSIPSCRFPCSSWVCPWGEKQHSCTGRKINQLKPIGGLKKQSVQWDSIPEELNDISANWADCLKGQSSLKYSYHLISTTNGDRLLNTLSSVHTVALAGVDIRKLSESHGQIRMNKARKARFVW